MFFEKCGYQNIIMFIVQKSQEDAIFGILYFHLNSRFLLTIIDENNDIVVKEFYQSDRSPPLYSVEIGKWNQLHGFESDLIYFPPIYKQRGLLSNRNLTMGVIQVII